MGVCLERLYLCVLFFIFLYGYLLHNVVYNAVVCINTIIYFSMGEKHSKANNHKAWKEEIPAYWSMFYEQATCFFLWPESLKIGPCALLHPSPCCFCFPPLLWSYWTVELIVRLTACIFAVLLKDSSNHTNCPFCQARIIMKYVLMFLFVPICYFICQDPAHFFMPHSS